jgi:hypothetical protein
MDRRLAPAEYDREEDSHDVVDPAVVAGADDVPDVASTAAGSAHEAGDSRPNLILLQLLKRL